MKYLWLCLLFICPMAEAKELHIPKGTKNVSQLHDELLMAFPSWKGTLTSTGRYENPLCQVESTNTKIILHVPDYTTEASVQAVITAHVPKPPPLDPQAELESAITNATTLQELKEALLGKMRKGKVEARSP